MRGRPRNKGPNPLTRTYESNGPDVKIRGTAQHVADKYAQLARDAQASGDPVSAENYFQHAEHYYRMIAAAQDQQRQQFGGVQRPFDEDGEEGDEEVAGGYGPGGGGLSAPQGGDDYGEAPGGYQPSYYEPRPNGQQQPRFDRNDRQQNRPQQRFDRNDRQPDRYGNDRQQDRYPDRNDRQDRGPDRNQDRGGYDRQAGDRHQAGDRQQPDRQQADRQGGERPPDRQAAERQPNDRQGGERPPYGERQDRTDRHNGERYDRNDRRDRFPRENRDAPQPAREARPDRQPNRGDPRFGEAQGEREPDAVGLPAFLTAPVPMRQPISVETPETHERAPQLDLAAGAETGPEANGIKTRRRRTRKAEPTGEGALPAADDIAEHDAS